MSLSRDLDIFYRLAAQTKAWGGSLSIVSERQFLENSRRPEWTCPPEEGHAIHYPTKAIICTQREMNVGTIVHEMGHVFADLNPPDKADEWHWMGWEICLARQAGCYRQWSKSARHYRVEWEQADKSWPYWKNLPAHGKQLVASNRIRHAIENGLVTPELHVRALR